MLSIIWNVTIYALAMITLVSALAVIGMVMESWYDARYNNKCVYCASEVPEGNRYQCDECKHLYDGMG